MRNALFLLVATALGSAVALLLRSECARCEGEVAEPEAPEQTVCQGMTRAGKPCRRKPEPGSVFCWQHGGAS